MGGPDGGAFVSRCFLVPKKQPNQFRMVVDLRHVNDFALTPPSLCAGVFVDALLFFFGFVHSFM